MHGHIRLGLNLDRRSKSGDADAGAEAQDATEVGDADGSPMVALATVIAALGGDSSPVTVTEDADDSSSAISTPWWIPAPWRIPATPGSVRLGDGGEPRTLRTRTTSVTTAGGRWPSPLSCGASAGLEKMT
ncbi:hypothetical protein BS78_04G173300 [Paspalum vaginatum]|nr:hypothetical protein BS78_04G173300 [Paspalum vaginatum]